MRIPLAWPVVRCSALVALAMVLWQPQARGGGGDSQNELLEESLEAGIDASTLVRMLGREDVTILDARGEASYVQLHIKGAKNLSTSAFETDFDSLREELTRPGQVVVVYCSQSTCDDSHRLAKRLREAGIKEVRIFSGGMKEWTGARFPIEGTGAAVVYRE